MTEAVLDSELNIMLELSRTIREDLGDGEARVDIFDKARELADTVENFHAALMQGEEYPTVWQRKDALEKPKVGQTYGYVLLDIALGKPPTYQLYPGITALQLAIVAMSFIDTCPKCGSVAWANPSTCDLCHTCSDLIHKTNTIGFPL